MGTSTNVSYTHYQIRDIESFSIVLEKYYYRNNSYASASISLIISDAQSYVSIITSGAGNGLLNLSFGANSSYLQTIIQVLHKHNFS